MTVTPSIAYGCVDLLGIISRNSMLHLSDAHNIPVACVGAKRIVDTLTKLRMIDVGENGILNMLNAGSTILESASEIGQVRKFLMTYMDVERPPWLQLVPKGRRFALQFAPEGVRQILYECGLAREISPDVVRYWDMLAQHARGNKGLRRGEIGRKGEAYTVEYESRRVRMVPSWVAVDDATLGYDVLSVVSRKDENRLRIEVKASVQQVHKANFYISRNEWEVASSSGFHLFHLWLLRKEDVMLAKLTVDEVAVHIPRDRESGSWTDVKIPYGVFEDKFVSKSVL